PVATRAPPPPAPHHLQLPQPPHDHIRPPAHPHPATHSRAAPARPNVRATAQRSALPEARWRLRAKIGSPWPPSASCTTRSNYETDAQIALRFLLHPAATLGSKRRPGR